MASEDLADVTTQIGRTEARLRSLHLAAHIRTRRILSGAQVARYDRLRGYTGGNGHGGHEGGEHG